MNVTPVPQLDDRVRAAQAAGDHGRAVTAIVEHYGPDLRRFFRVRLRNHAAADEAFAIFTEDLWRGFARFAWQSSLRTWLYVLARHAASRLLSAERRAPALLPSTGALQALPEPGTREHTDPALRTESKARVRSLRDGLSHDEQTLLVLRVDRGLAWRELALVMGEARDDASKEELTRASARMRTRFQTAKRRLKELARDAGLALQAHED